MGFLSKKGTTFGWPEAITLVTIVGLATSTLYLLFNKYIAKKERPGWAMQDMTSTGTAIGSFYSTPGEDTVWLYGSDEAVSKIKAVFRMRQ